MVVIITSKEIQEPTVLERTSPAVIIKAPELEWIWPRGSGTRSRQCWEEFLALTVEYQLRLVALSEKENYTVITICVLNKTSVKEILEPAMLDVDYSCCLKSRLPSYRVTLNRDSVSGKRSPIV